MTNEQMIRELRAVAKKYEGKHVFTFETNIHLMATDAANRIESLCDEINRQKAEIERLEKENADREISHINLYNEMKDRLRDAKKATNMYKQFWLDSYNEGEMYEAKVKAKVEGKFEAVKEFAERLKKDRYAIFNTMYSDFWFSEAIDNLVKEFDAHKGETND